MSTGTDLTLVDALSAQGMVESFERIVREAAEEVDGSWSMVRTGQEPATYTGGIPIQGRIITTLQSRDEGRYWPYYEHEFQLQKMRSLCRQLGTFTSIAVGAMQALQVYVMGGEWEYEVIAKYGEEPAEEFIAEVQTVLDTIIERNKFIGVLDSEIHDASREDGCSPVAMYATPDGLVDMRRLDADNLREPQNRSPLDAFLGTDWQTPAGKPAFSWTFGVLTGFDERMGRIDHERHLGYHVIYDDTGSEYDFMPAWPMSEGPLSDKCLHLFNRNVPARAKIGISDFFPVAVDLEREDKINTNVGVVTAILAAIPWFETLPEGATKEQAQTQFSDALDNFSRAVAKNRGGERPLNRIRPGTTKVVSAGREFTTGPLGAPKSDAYNGARAAIMRRIGVRWLFPEYMISGDASNENYASSLVAESPFVKARQGDQRYYVGHNRDLLMKALKIAHDRGRFRKWCSDWAKFVALIDLNIKPPEVATRDKAQHIAELFGCFDRGIIDGNEVRVDLRREMVPELEGLTGSQNMQGESALAQQGAAQTGNAPQLDANGQPMPPQVDADGKPIPGAGDGTGGTEGKQAAQQGVDTGRMATGSTLNGAQVTAAAEILHQVSDGTTAEIVAIGLLTGIGMSPELAEEMTAAAVAKAGEVKAQKEKDAAMALKQAAASGRGAPGGAAPPPSRESVIDAALAEAVLEAETIEEARAVARAV